MRTCAYNKQGTVPDAVIQVMTKNLFDLQAGHEPAKHPVDDLAAFIARMNRIRVGDGEIEMNAAGSGKTKEKT